MRTTLWTFARLCSPAALLAAPQSVLSLNLAPVIFANKHVPGHAGRAGRIVRVRINVNVFGNMVRR